MDSLSGNLLVVEIKRSERSKKPKDKNADKKGKKVAVRFSSIRRSVREILGEKILIHIWWCMPVISELGSWGQENQEFKASLGYKVRLRPVWTT